MYASKELIIHAADQLHTIIILLCIVSNEDFLLCIICIMHIHIPLRNDFLKVKFSCHNLRPLPIIRTRDGYKIDITLKNNVLVGKFQAMGKQTNKDCKLPKVYSTLLYCKH